MHYETTEGAQVESETLSACTDCLFFVEFGNHDEHAEALNRSEWRERQAWLERAHAGRDFYPGERLDEFSTSACEICGSCRGGERHAIIELSDN